MTAIIESTIEMNTGLTDIKSSVSRLLEMFDVMREFNAILSVIHSVEDENSLRRCLRDHFMDEGENILKHFSYGFGSSHFWVHQKGHNERLIFVPFND